MWSHIINIHSSELLCTKTKEYKINEHKKIYKIKDNLYFLPNNILTRLFKELNIYIYMTINNILIIYVRIILCILIYIF